MTICIVRNVKYQFETLRKKKPKLPIPIFFIFFFWYDLFTKRKYEKRLKRINK